MAVFLITSQGIRCFLYEKKNNKKEWNKPITQYLIWIKGWNKGVLSGLLLKLTKNITKNDQFYKWNKGHFNSLSGKRIIKKILS